MEIKSQSVIKCPVCGHTKEETMPTDAPVSSFMSVRIAIQYCVQKPAIVVFFVRMDHKSAPRNNFKLTLCNLLFEKLSGFSIYTTNFISIN